MTLSSVPPMTDVMRAYRLFAQAHRLPDLTQAGFKAISRRLLTTEQGAAAMVLYEDQQGRRISYYIRPPGPQNNLLPRGSSHSDGLQAEYWSGGGYNYAMVSPSDQPTTEMLK